MNDMDRALESLKIQIKKEIIDNFFADRVYLEEEMELLRQEAEAYRKEVDLLRHRFMSIYQALGSETACALMLEVLNLKEWPFYQEYCRLEDGERRELLRGRRRRGFTAWRQFRNLVFDLYEELEQANHKLRETYDKIITHQKLINEDIDKFNLNYDFGLIAAQIEAMEGRGEVISGGLMGTEREELSTRMRLKHPRLTDGDLPPVPELRPLKEVREKLEAVLLRAYRP